jgi:hypothetical protein
MMSIDAHRSIAKSADHGANALPETGAGLAGRKLLAERDYIASCEREST